MKQILLSITLTFYASALFGQAVVDASFTDCNNNTRTVYQALATGKVLFIANAGTNCGICMNHAPGVATMANGNPNTIEVWGSMTTKSGGLTNCATVGNWISTYGWTNVFAFVDSANYWFDLGTPRYTVIDPSDSTVAYSGSNYSAAETLALQLATAFDVKELKLVNSISVLPMAIRVSFSNASKAGEAALYNLTGARVQRWNIPAGASTIDLPLSNSPNKGLYLLRMTIGGKDVVEKVMF